MSRDDRRTMMLEAARAVVFRHGYRKATLEDVAHEAGVSRATLYNYFSNKQELFRAIMVYELDELREVMAASLDPEAPVDQRLMAWLRARYSELARVKELYAVVMDVAKDVMLMAMGEFDTFQEEQVTFLRELMEEGIREGTFREVDSDALSKAVWAALRGVDEGFVFEGRDDLAHSAEVLVSTLLQGLRS